ncbi:hypothetical protein NTE19_003368 [Vibrio fluvialis]|nr:hypothetical protein [Vibrio fluvialis]
MQLSEIKTLFENGLSVSTFWSRFKNSEFFTYLVNYITQIWYRNNQALEVRLMEGHISQAQQASSVRAHAQDRSYVPIKRIPTKIQALVKNPSARTLSITNTMTFVNEADGFTYMCPEGAILEPGDEKTLEFIQAQIVSKEYEITSEKAYIEILFDLALSRSLASFSVRVYDPALGAESTWKPSYLFRNTTAEDNVYVERATALGNCGFMFGDGVSSGKIPPAGSIIRVDCLTTEGAITVAPDQGLVPDDENLAENLLITTGLTLIVGSEREGIESIRKNAQYSTIYDNKTVWDNDYKFYVNRNFDGLSFLSVWGERGQELLVGEKKEEHRGKIYICAYHPNMTLPEVVAGVQTICDALNDISYNKDHVPVEPTLNPYTIVVTGKALTSRKIEDVKASIQLALEQFDDSNTTHNGKTTVDDIYHVIRETGLLTGFKVDFSLDLSTSVAIDTFRYLDIAGSTFTITY